MRETTHATLAATLWPATGARLLRQGALVLAGTILLTLSAKAQVPFWPVPMTLQTLVVLVLGAAYGPALAASTVALYLAEGLAGLPVFAGAAAGPAYMMGPTGGYLVGFLVAAIVMGALAQRGFDRTLPRLLGLMTLGHAVIFAFGFAWMAVLFGAEKAFALGVAPFWAATIVKTLLAAFLVSGLWSAVNRIRG